MNDQKFVLRSTKEHCHDNQLLSAAVSRLAHNRVALEDSSVEATVEAGLIAVA